MAAVPDTIAQQRIQELEITLRATEKRNGELGRHIELLQAENDKLRESEATARAEARTLRMQLAGRLPLEEE